MSTVFKHRVRQLAEPGLVLVTLFSGRSGQTLQQAGAFRLYGDEYSEYKKSMLDGADENNVEVIFEPEDVEGKRQSDAD